MELFLELKSLVLSAFLLISLMTVNMGITVFLLNTDAKLERKLFICSIVFGILSIITIAIGEVL